MTAKDVENWIMADDSELHMNDEETVESVLCGENSPQSDYEEIKEKISYETAYSVLQITLTFLEQHPDITVRKLRHFAAQKRVAVPKQ